MIGPVIATFGSQEQKERFLPATANLDIWWCQGFSEPDAGSDLASLRTTAVRDGDDWVVNGQKTWTTLGQHADWIFCLVRTDPAAEKKQRGISLLVFPMDSPGVTLRPIELIDGEREVNEVFLEDVRVPAENLVGEEGSGFVQIAMAFVTERVGLAVQGYSTGERCLQLATRHARERQAFGRRLIDNQVVRHKLVEMHRRVEAARVYTREVARRYDAGEQPLVEALHAKRLGVDAAAHCVDEAVQLHGGTGYMHGTEVERHYRDARLLGIGGGANEVLDDLAAKLLGYAS
jgi:hypothetical protein